MRNPNRIPKILAIVQRAWEREPDSRLGQLILNAAGGDPFYLEDGALAAKLTMRAAKKVTPDPTP